jgi:glycosyltransferase involved in cell wall biosynthesis
LRAAAQLPDVVFLLAGDGPRRTMLEQEAAELGVTERIVFLGARDDIPVLLETCDVFALPSLNEGLPLTVLEAMAARRPVIATSVGGIPEVVLDGETGILVPPADPHALAVGIRSLLADPTRARHLALAGQQRGRREFSVSSMVQRVSEVYVDVLASSPRATCGW